MSESRPRGRMGRFALRTFLLVVVPVAVGLVALHLYARGGRLKWGAQGQPGAIRRWVRSRRFAHSSGRLHGTGARQVWFHKKTIAKNTTGYQWTLICTN